MQSFQSKKSEIYLFFLFFWYEIEVPQNKLILDCDLLLMTDFLRFHKFGIKSINYIFYSL